jgi:hypothetical protein
MSSRLALESTQTPIQSGRGMKVITHPQLVPRSRKCGATHPLPHAPSRRSTYLIKHRDNFTFLPVRRQ